MSRILKGYQYFYNRKPSQWTPTDTIWLHKWMEMIEHLLKDREATEEDARKIFES